MFMCILGFIRGGGDFEVSAIVVGVGVHMYPKLVKGWR